MYIVTRSDLPPGLQAAQACHAAFKFSVASPVATERWMMDSNFLVVCAVPDELTLAELAGEAFRRFIPRVIVREPDIDNQVTAVAFAPGPESRKLCGSLPLALRELSMT